MVTTLTELIEAKDTAAKAFTPRPWTEYAPAILANDDDGSHTKFNTDSNYRSVCAGAGCLEIDKGFCLTGYISPADSRLIAAAPDLYEALQQALVRLKQCQEAAGSGFYPSCEAVIDLVCKALAKAVEA